MGFDQNDPRPTTVTTHKQTTKVNIGIVIGVLIFFAVAAGALLWFNSHSGENSRDQHEKMTQPPAP